MALSLAVAGCAAPLPEGFSDTAQPQFGAPPVPLGEDEMPAPLVGEDAPPPAAEQAQEAPPEPVDDEQAPTEPPADPPEPADAGEPAPPQPDPPRAEPRTVGAVSDPRGDHGREGPAYADIVAVTIVDDGPLLRVMVDVADTLPAQPGSGEVIGVGVDLFHDPADPESSFQLFADGGEEGWRAHLHTPEGFVEYPGTFRLGGRRIAFEVPWAAVGDPRSGGFRTFIDWSQRRLVLNAVSQDFAPDSGTAPFAR